MKGKTLVGSDCSRNHIISFQMNFSKNEMQKCLKMSVPANSLIFIFMLMLKTSQLV